MFHGEDFTRFGQKKNLYHEGHKVHAGREKERGEVSAPEDIGDVEIVAADLKVRLVGDESFTRGDIGLIEAEGVFVIRAYIGEKEEDLISLGRPDHLGFKRSARTGQLAIIIEDAGGQVDQVGLDPQRIFGVFVIDVIQDEQLFAVRGEGHLTHIRILQPFVLVRQVKDAPAADADGGIFKQDIVDVIPVLAGGSRRIQVGHSLSSGGEDRF